MSDITTDEEPDDIAEQLLLDEFLTPEEVPEVTEPLEQEPEPTELERDIYERELGAAISYVVYYSGPRPTEA